MCYERCTPGTRLGLIYLEIYIFLREVYCDCKLQDYEHSNIAIQKLLEGYDCQFQECN